MPEPIVITKQEGNSDDWTFSVTVGSGTDTTNHTVILTKDYWQLLSIGNEGPESLIRRSFEFLLEREPKEAILPHFDLPLINHYFPEYEKEIRVSQ